MTIRWAVPVSFHAASTSASGTARASIWRVLGILRDREPTMAELATYLGLERSTVGGLIDRAAERGLVRKNADPADGRSVRVNLTGEARRLQTLLVAEIDELMAPLTDRLSSGEQNRLTALPAKVLER